MEIIPPYLRINQQILKDLENAFPYLNVPKAKAGRKPKLTDIQIAAILHLHNPVRLSGEFKLMGHHHYGDKAKARR